MDHAYVYNGSYLPMVYDQQLWSFVLDKRNQYDNLCAQKIYLESFRYKECIRFYLDKKTDQLPPVTLLWSNPPL